MKRSMRWCVLLAAVAGAIAAACAPAADRAAKTAAGAADPRAALCSLTHRTLARPAAAKRLFVEGYFMRSLVAAAEAAPCDGDSLWKRRALERAIAWADTLVATQDAHGFWKIGYATGWVADMAAAVGIYRALETHVDTARLDRYTASAAKFVAGLERDRLLLSSGAVGIGWPLEDRPANTVRVWHSDAGWSDSTYLVSTSLAGVAVQSWLWKRTGRAEVRDRAERAFDVTLGALQADGTLPTRGRGEGPHNVAAYVQEGWMAAVDAGIVEGARLDRFRAALPRHVAWLTRTQQPNGLWESSIRGDAARAVAIVDFLVWLQSTGIDPAVAPARTKAATGLASAVLADPAGASRDDDHEVWRAHAGRALAAVVGGRGVP